MRLELFGFVFQPAEAQNIQGLRSGCEVDVLECTLAIQSMCERSGDLMACDVWLN